MQNFVFSIAYANIISLVEFSVKGEPFPDLWISRVTAVTPVVLLPICWCVDMIMPAVCWISYHHILVKVFDGQGVFITSGLYVNNMWWELSVEKPYWTVNATLLLHWPMCVQAYDQHLNMILGEVEEVVTSVEIDDETYEEIVRVRHQLFSFSFSFSISWLICAGWSCYWAHYVCWALEILLGLSTSCGEIHKNYSNAIFL